MGFRMDLALLYLPITDGGSLSLISHALHAKQGPSAIGGTDLAHLMRPLLSLPSHMIRNKFTIESLLVLGQRCSDHL